ncbi:MAG TPA: hypothetical protein VN345_01975 [Blastocatellia bacterium]|jgi:hypothetical protein|nr:hypothetical protein [Blastocatellia bacterium]
MAMHEGDQYRCPEHSCGCEIEVTKGTQMTAGANFNPRCCCGKEMQKTHMAQVATQTTQS